MYFKSLWSIVLRGESHSAVCAKHYLRHTKPLKASARHHDRGGGQELLTSASVQGGNLSGPTALPASFNGVIAVCTLFS